MLNKSYKTVFVAILASIFGFISNVFAHSVQVGYCVNCDGDLRVYVEHWHGSQNPNSTTMNLQLNVGGSITAINGSPQGNLQNIPFSSLPECTTPLTVFGSCSGKANTYNDWVIYDFANVPCGVPVSITIISGNTVFTQDGCGMFPATTGTFTIPCINSVGGSNQSVCEGDVFSGITFPSIGSTYNWTNSNPSIGLPASGTGNIPSFTAASVSSTQTANITVNYFACSSTSFQLTVKPKPQSNFTFAPACPGLPTSFTDLSTSAGGGITNWKWNFGDGSAEVTSQNPVHSFPLNGAPFNVSLETTAGGCKQEITQSISGLPELDLSGNFTSSTCNQSDGVVKVIVDQGVPSYSYLWGGSLAGQNTSAVSGVPQGTYVVTVTDGNGCENIFTDVLLDAVPPTVAILSSGNVSCNGGADGFAQASVAGGTPPFSYLWNDGQANATAVGLSAGLWTVSITDATGCISETSVAITEPNVLTSSITGVNHLQCETVCDGNATVQGSGGTSPYSYQWSGGTNSTTPTVLNLCKGGYQVTITDVNGCSSVSAVTITSPPALSLTLNASALSCAGATDGTISPTLNGGVIPYNYFWSTVATTASISGLSIGTYSLSVTDANNCAISSSLTISNPLQLSLTGSYVPSTCLQADGTVAVSVTQGIPNYSYLWGGAIAGQTTATVTGVAAGNYTVTVTDGNGCDVLLTQPVSDALAPTISVLSASDISCYGFSDGYIQTSVVGGTTPYNYYWNDGQTTSSSSGLIAGNWSATMTDGTGCKTSISQELTEPLPLVAAIPNHVDISCFGFDDGEAFVFTAGGTTPYSYQWNSGHSTPTVTGLSQGDYEVVVTDAQNCVFSTSVTIIEPAEILITPAVSDAFCNSPTGDICLDVSNGILPISYNWSNGQSSNCAGALLPGNYRVTVTGLDGCEKESSIIVGNIAPGIVTITDKDDISCFGENDGMATAAIVGGFPPYQYLWDSNAQYQTNLTATGLSGGDFTISITDFNNCLVTTSVTIVEPTILTVTTTKSNIGCHGICDGSITANSNGGITPYAYEWSDPVSQSLPTAVDLCEGNYSVTVTDNNECTFIADDFISAVASINIDSVVSDANCGLNNGNICLTVGGGALGYTYLWETGATGQCVSGLAAGSYSVTVSDSNFCAQPFVAIVSNKEGPSISITSITDVLCNADSTGALCITASGGSGSYNYAWKDGLGNSYGSLPCVNNLKAGVYSVSVSDIITGCISVAVETINEPQPFNHNIQTENPSCFGYDDGTASIFLTGGVPPYSYQWNTIPLQTLDQATGLDAGTYSVEVTDANGCSEIWNSTLTNPLLIETQITKTSISCNGVCDATATIVSVNGIGNYSYEWSNGQAFSTGFNLCADNHIVTITDGNGCYVTTNINIQEPPAFQVNTVSIGDVSCAGGTDGYIQLSPMGGTFPYNYNWSFNVSSTSSASGLSSNTYFITVTDSLGCQEVLSEQISQPTSLNAAILSTTDVSCFGACDGVATVSASGGSTPYQFQWDLNAGFQSTADAINLCAYDGILVTVTDAQNCTIVKSTSISEPSSITITLDTISPHCGFYDGEINITVTGGVSPYAYNWNNPSVPNTPTVTGLSAGCYTLDILDANFCVHTETFCLNDVDGPSVSYVSHDDCTCYNSGDGSLIQLLQEEQHHIRV